MFFAMVGKLTEGGMTTKHHGCFVGPDKNVVITNALKLKEEWEKKGPYDTKPKGPYEIWAGVVQMAIEPIPPVVQFREVPIS